ncbi:DUF4956 domain-containing protein [Isoptericola sediminis]|uniref:DUF4956 domain-containing protein n=1 Tax=Isoptericola sediminis TaxID=2733572 RepID=A0A849KD36_9MICO|nr:DUF4956 domain-containing protein [Isoptericola sediminis]NNU26463.1 DUF4956 domain-containing protein [Isoptericola sediminis]
MTPALLYAFDALAVTILVLALYFPRHRRRDLVVAYLGVNVGVLAVATVLAQSSVGAGLGLGLFGVLSIIRLRSRELSQHEVAYYFAALALGLLGGLGAAVGWLAVAGMALVVLVMAIADHPRLFARHRTAQVVVDRALPDHDALVAHLEHLLDACVHGVTVLKLDLANDTTVVDVRYRVGAGTTAALRRRTKAPDSPAPAPENTPAHLAVSR